MKKLGGVFQLNLVVSFFDLIIFDLKLIFLVLLQLAFQRQSNAVLSLLAVPLFDLLGFALLITFVSSVDKLSLLFV